MGDDADDATGKADAADAADATAAGAGQPESGDPEPGELEARELEAQPIEAIRSMRAECQDRETGLSFLRRVAQGRLDIVDAELTRRREGGAPGDLASLIDQLPAILADHLRAPGTGRLPSTLGAGTVDPELEAEVDAIVERIDDLAAVTDDELVAARERLGQVEHDISARRRSLFDRIDALQAELTRRYRTGEASVESLLS